MRICDKCEKRLVAKRFSNLMDKTEIDLCDGCYQIFADWLYSMDRKKENDPVEDKPVKIDRRRKENK